jgi:hypothetical protein
VKALLYDVEATVQNSASLRDADQFAGVAKEIARLRVRRQLDSIAMAALASSVT